MDGFFAGPNGEIDWHQADDEYIAYAKAFLNNVDMLLFGRVTYQLMAAYWPTSTQDIAHEMNMLPKLVVSKTLNGADWNNTTVVKENVVDVIASLKQQPGKPLAVLGSASLASYLRNAGLVDEYHLTVVPVLLGHGKSLFTELRYSVNMKLLKSSVHRSGNVQLHYQLFKEYRDE